MKAILICLAAFALFGCAGVVAPFVNNPYAGTYTGTYATSDGKSGPASINLTNIGNVFGTLTDTASGEKGNLNGSVNTKLVFNGSVEFPGSTQNVSGTLASVGGHVTGKLNGTNGYFITVDVMKQ